MAKPLITLSNTATLAADFQTYLDGNNVPFVVLGDTAAHQALAEKAADLAQDWEIAILVPEPAGLYPALTELGTNDCVLAAEYDAPNMFAVCLSPDSVICYVMTTDDAPSIPMAYMSAESA
jgi:hypothetical protein